MQMAVQEIGEQKTNLSGLNKTDGRTSIILRHVQPNWR